MPPKRVVGRSCCRGAYLRGALLGAGSLSGPRDPHLEMRASSIEASAVHRRRRSAGGGALSVAERRNHAVAYAKGHEAIGDLLAWPARATRRCGSRSTPSSRRRAPSANRLANADEANLVRTARAAHVQLEAIRALDVDSLPAPLAEIAELRLRHPSASLRELAAKVRPPITKAAAHRRLRAVVELADRT